MNKSSCPATERNRKPIVDQLIQVLRGSKKVLEIGSGTGEHAVWFAPRLSWLTWIPSDLPRQQEVIKQWLQTSPQTNLHPPIVLDVNGLWPQCGHDAIFTANTAHIIPWPGVKKMISFGASTLPVDGIFCLYGPVIFEHVSLANSNREFDRQLRSTDPEKGLRKFEELNRVARDANMCLVENTPLPANNNLLVWRKAASYDCPKG